ncbi:hypothetical protein ACE6ED_14010 [Paenibacillus sp. CN-4]|uniref:hypothetical protein n=1 Tax=Paenibacillus nanchangensis TaxID=3348343 RepID=UPI00397CF19D
MSIEIVLIPLAIAVTKQVAEAVSVHREKLQARHVILETRMKDEVLLREALEEWSCSFRQVEHTDSLESLEWSMANEVTFLQQENGSYSLVLPQGADVTAYTEWVDNVETSYTKHLQQKVYRNLIEQAREQGMVMEKEEVLEDQSIQITYVLNR